MIDVDLLRNKELSSEEWNLEKLNLVDMDLSGSNLNDLDLSDFDFSDFDLSKANFTNSILTNSKLINTNLKDANLTNANFDGADLSNSNLTNVVASNCSFKKTKLINARAKGTNFNVSDFSYADLSGIEVDTNTSFGKITECINCKIDRYSLDSLGDNSVSKGGLGISDLNKMKINDDFQLLKLSFSGFLMKVHMVSFCLFVFPYLFFLFKLWSISYGFLLFEYVPKDGVKNTIGSEFLEYIYTSGGLNNDIPWGFLIAIFLIVYNIFRIVLLWKTISLEHKNIVTGLPVHFLINVYWKTIYNFVKYGMIFNITFVFLHTINFLSKEMPL